MVVGELEVGDWMREGRDFMNVNGRLTTKTTLLTEEPWPLVNILVAKVYPFHAHPMSSGEEFVTSIVSRKKKNVHILFTDWVPFLCQYLGSITRLKSHYLKQWYYTQAQQTQQKTGRTCGLDQHTAAAATVAPVVPSSHLQLLRDQRLSNSF